MTQVSQPSKAFGGHNRHWTDVELDEMRRMAHSKSLAQVGLAHGITRQRVGQLLGRLNRRQPPTGGIHALEAEARRARAAELFAAGLSDAQIATELWVSVGTVAAYRSQMGLTRAFRLSAEHCFHCLNAWVELFDYVPGAADWSPNLARRYGHERRALRFEEFRTKFHCPYASSIVVHFPSWSDFVEAGGHPRPPKGARYVPWREAPLLSELE